MPRCRLVVDSKGLRGPGQAAVNIGRVNGAIDLYLTLTMLFWQQDVS